MFGVQFMPLKDLEAGDKQRLEFRIVRRRN